MVPLNGILVVATMVFFCDEVRETVVAGAVTEADEDSATDADDFETDADEDLDTEADVAPEPPLRLNSLL